MSRHALRVSRVNGTEVTDGVISVTTVPRESLRRPQRSPLDYRESTQRPCATAN